MTDIERELRDSYGKGAEAWAGGAARVYHRLADALVERVPIPLAGSIVLDLGTGTGVASRAAASRGAVVIACDAAFGMLAHDAASRPPAVCGDAVQLPFRDRTFDAVVAACVLNHVPDVDAALAASARVCIPGGAIVASTFSTRQHPAKTAIDGVLERYGYRPPEWYVTFKAEREPLSDTAGKLRAAALRVGLVDVDAQEIDVDLSTLGADALAAYRLGMAQVQPFVTGLTPSQRARLEREAAAAGAPSLSVPMPLLVLVARVPG